MAWTFSASAGLVGEPFLWGDGTVSLARSFLRELPARADLLDKRAYVSSRAWRPPLFGCAQE